MKYRISSRQLLNVYSGRKLAYLRIQMFKIQSTRRVCSPQFSHASPLQLVSDQIFFKPFSEITLTRSFWVSRVFSINYLKIVMRCAKFSNSRGFCILLQYGWMLHTFLCENQLGHNGAQWRLSRSRWVVLATFCSREIVSGSYCRYKLQLDQLFN